MTLDALISIVDKYYDDGLIMAYYKADEETTKTLGDGLARFIVAELIDTFEPDQDDHDQLSEACRILQVAQEQLRTVVFELSTHM